MVRVTYWEPFIPAKTDGPPEWCYPAEGGDGHWHICDKRGRSAPWLEKKMTVAEHREIQRLVFDTMENQGPEYDPD